MNSTRDLEKDRALGRGNDERLDRLSGWPSEGSHCGAFEMN